MQGSLETYSSRGIITFLACFLVKQTSRTTGWERSRHFSLGLQNLGGSGTPRGLPASLLSPVLLHLPTPVLIHWIRTVCAICSCRRALPSSCQKQSLLYFALSTFSHNFCPQGLCSLHQILKLWRQSDVGSLPPPLLIIFDFCINLILLSFSFLSYKKNWITWLSKLNCREYVKCLKLAVSPEFSYLCGGALEHCG